MRSYDVTTKQWRRKVIAGALVTLGLLVIGLPNSQAQMDYDGGYIQYHRHPSLSTIIPRPPPSRPKTTMPASISPDNDFYYYSTYTPPTISVSRSNYPENESRRWVSPFGVSAAVLPWNQAGFEEYDPFPETVSESSFSAPGKYALEATPLLGVSPTRRSETAMLIVHLPEYTPLWVQGKRTPLKGATSYFTSPPLNPGKKYIYTVRAAWLEYGRWVSLTRKVPIEAGLIQTLYLRPIAPVNRQ